MTARIAGSCCRKRFFGRHERQLFVEMLFDDLRVHNQTIDDIAVQDQDCIDRQERLR